MGDANSKQRAMPTTNSNGSSIPSTVPIQNNSSSKSERAVWYYNSRGSSDLSWIPFTGIDNTILEEAYSKKEKQVQLDDCLVDLDKWIQIDNQDSSIRRPIKREILLAFEAVPLRSERFYAPQNLVKSFSDADSNVRRFVNEWKRQYQTISMDEKLEQSIEGITREGFILGKQVEAEWIARQLRSVKGKSDAEVEKCIVSLYTHESFLYRLVNTALRQNDQSKLNTLGAFCQLLCHCDCSSTFRELGYAGELYRGAELDQQTIESYKQAVGQVKTWDAFSSTSKNRAKAEKFGNVLFIINRAKSSRYRFSGMDISSLSFFPEEEEVLVRAARNFTVEKVEKDDDTGKHFIFLSLC